MNDGMRHEYLIGMGLHAVMISAKIGSEPLVAVMASNNTFSENFAGEFDLPPKKPAIVNESFRGKYPFQGDCHAEESIYH